jgi:hypothetical protein
MSIFLYNIWYDRSINWIVCQHKSKAKGVGLTSEVVESLADEGLNWVYFVEVACQQDRISQAIVVQAKSPEIDKLLSTKSGFELARSILLSGTNGIIYQACQEDGKLLELVPAKPIGKSDI